MRRYFAILGVIALLVMLVFCGTFQVPTALAQDGQNSAKISSLLKIQVEAKLRAQKGVPLAEGQVDIVHGLQATGAAVGSLNKQKIFLHSAQ